MGPQASAATQVRVRYAETDKMGVVYYANYFGVVQVARTDWLRSLGCSYREMEPAGVALPVIEAHCEYRRPANYDDEIEIKDESASSHPVRVNSITISSRGAAGRPVRRGIGANDARGGGAGGKAVPAPQRVTGALPMKALVTGAAGFIGSHLAGRCSTGAG